MDPISRLTAAVQHPARRDALRGAASALVTAALYGLPRQVRASAPARRVLIVHSFAREIAPYDAVIVAFRRELASRSPVPVVFLEAALDAGRVIDVEEEAAFIAYLRERFAQPAPDLLLSSAAPAGRFLARHREAIFPGVPMLLAAIDARNVVRAALKPGDAAIATVLDLPRAFADVLRVLPRTNTIAVVLGATPLERFWRTEIQRETAFLADRVNFVWFDGLSLVQMKQRVAALPPHSAVFYGQLIVDAAGVPHERLEALAELRQVSNAPIFAVFENELGRGVIGGAYMSQSRAGQATALAALRMWAAPPDAPPFVESFGMQGPAYDWRELRRWGIDASLLPPGSELRNRPPSPWVEYRDELAAAVAVFGAQAALIGALLVQRARRRRAEEEARALGGRLITAHEDQSRRLARELHDDITQRLAGVSIEAATLARLPDAQARQAAERSISGELAQLSRDVHALSYRLHPSIVDDLGLSEALRIECERAARRGAAEVRFDGDRAGDSTRGDRALCLFRVAQEALGNALSHARPRQVQVALRAEDGGISVSVVDDGCGFDLAAERKRASLGLASMRERVALLGGRLQMSSRPGQGTRVTAWVPAAQAAP